MDSFSDLTWVTAEMVMECKDGWDRELTGEWPVIDAVARALLNSSDGYLAGKDALAIMGLTS